MGDEVAVLCESQRGSEPALREMRRPPSLFAFALGQISHILHLLSDRGVFWNGI